ncbi:MAG: hypothetical protein V4668_03860 [Patescibacteria group bacterium]
MLLRILICSAVFLLPIFTTSVHAQIGGDLTGIMGEGLSIQLDPQYPNPNDRVTATIDDYSMNNTGATITWYFDGLSAPAVKNLRKITFTAPTIGTTMSVIARLTFPDGRTIETKRVISPLYLDLIIEPQTYTPAFYQGRALPTKGSIVYINALLQNANGPVVSSEYSYSWSLNNKSIYGGARSGGNWAEIIVPHGSANIVTVAVQDRNGTTVARKLFTLPSVPVELRFYETNTLLGLSTRAITNSVILAGNSTTIKAVPYYLDTRAIQGNLFTEWSLDNLPVPTDNRDPFEINLSRGVSGKAIVGFKIRNLSELLQSDEKTFTVTF